MSPQTFYDYAKQYVYPIVDDTLLKQQEELFEDLKSQQDADRSHGLKLAIDCRFSRPGFTATYGVTSAMCLDTGKIVASVVKSKTDDDVSSSSAMETVGTKAVLKSIIEPWCDDNENAGYHAHAAASTSDSPDFCLPAPATGRPALPLQVNLLVTDENVAVMAMVKKESPDLRHEADPWHLRKSIMKRLHKAAAKKINQPLERQLPSIRIWLWTSMKECSGNADLLLELWRSTCYHVSGPHSWDSDETFTLVKKCAHGDLSDVDIGYLPKQSKAYEALAAVVNDPKIHKRLRRCTSFCQTSCLESFHSLLCKYLPKDLKFSGPAFESRVHMAICDWNENARRPHKTNKRGERLVTFEHPASVNQWRARYCRSERTSDWSDNIMEHLSAFALERWKAGHTIRASESMLST